MKSASYTYDARNRKLYCSVKEDNKGKISVSILAGAYNSCSADRYNARNLGMEIAKSGFDHPAITHLTVTNTKGLIELLKKETVDLRKAFIQKTREYSLKKYMWAKEYSKITYAEHLEKSGVMETSKYKITYKAENGEYVYGHHTRKVLPSYVTKNIDDAASIMNIGFIAFQAKEVNAAKSHYENSIERLAERLNQKGIKDDTKMTIKSGKIGVNFETTIHHDNTITRAWTIIAEGPIQRPHYRYLVK